MSITFSNPQTAPQPAAGYRNLAIIPGGHRLLVLAGQIGNTMDGSLLETVEDQYEQALKNIMDIVASEGGNASNVARISVFLVKKPQGKSIQKTNKLYFPDGPPAMSWLYVSGLFRPDVKVEIEAIAAVK
ncbi:MAG: hypothetical protein CMM58_02825 [Rhodospirillaceae bacterium]|nr:hypothetical protein [Rhodospirillaceae bacterium]|tara:strand:+ start:1379 stop:1768 length:390 start_codon:yes stop_codon:yes gene_type:complete